MLRQLVFLLIIYLTSVKYGKAANQDYILSIVNPKDSYEGYIEIDGKSTQGNGMSVCGWVILDEQRQSFFEARDDKSLEIYLRAYVSIFHNLIVGTNEKGSERFFGIVLDCNMKNITSWFHICFTLNQTSFYFYVNGFPSANYTMKQNPSVRKSDNLSIVIGDTSRLGGNSSFYQINVFDRALTVKDAKKMYKCNFMNGDMLSWKDITSKSNNIKFGNNTQLIQAPVPCPTPPPYKPINCSTGEPLEDPSNSEAEKPGSCSTSANSGLSLTSGDSGLSSTSGDSGLSSPSGDSGLSSPSGDSGICSPSADSGQSSTSGEPGSSSQSEHSGPSSTSGDSGSSSPNAGPVASSGK